jgi:hypothetical protein
VAEVDQELDAGAEVVAGEVEAELDRGRGVEPARRIVAQGAIELVDPAREAGGLEVRGGEVLAQALERAPRVRGRARDQSSSSAGRCLNPPRRTPP